MALGVIIFLFNFLTMTLWGIDIDILGVMIFVLGLVIAIACGKTMKQSSKLLTRKNGVRLCITVVLITMILAFSPFPALNGDITGIVGLVFFLFSIILIILRWKY